MFLKIKETGGILFHPQESVSLSIVHVGPYLVALVCIRPFIDYLFRVYLIFWVRTIFRQLLPSIHIEISITVHYYYCSYYSYHSILLGMVWYGIAQYSVV
jgi:hypothetical protein